MLLVDPRAGSGDLLPFFKPLGVPARHQQMDYGDLAFVGDGPGGMPRLQGVEVKKLPDLIQCMGNGRFAGHQLPGLVEHYDDVWLVVEGEFQPNWRDGILEWRGPKGQWRWTNYTQGRRLLMHRELAAWLLTMELKAGVRVVRTNSREDTARWMAALYHWWTQKEWDEHRSHLAFDESAPSMEFRKPTLLRRVAKELPGVGWKRSRAVEAEFASVKAMVDAEESTWRGIEGIGKTLARKIYQSLRGR